MKALAALVLFFILIVLLREIYFLWQENKQESAQYQTLQKEFQKAQASYQQLQSELQYYSNPANLEKELRQRFNYRKPGEKTIIVVPQGSSPTNQ